LYLFSIRPTMFFPYHGHFTTGTSFGRMFLVVDAPWRAGIS